MQRLVFFIAISLGMGNIVHQLPDVQHPEHRHSAPDTSLDLSYPGPCSIDQVFPPSNVFMYKLLFLAVKGRQGISIIMYLVRTLTFLSVRGFLVSTGFLLGVRKGEAVMVFTDRFNMIGEEIQGQTEGLYLEKRILRFQLGILMSKISHFSGS